ncbi:MAG: hypothetical protein K1X94_01715 [Sandaracinaceae bacterium]|nr:hypothetical protein [Sandaracinaceae bacterium]
MRALSGTLLAALSLALVGCPSTPAPSPDTGTAVEADAYVEPGEDAAAPTDDAYACPMRNAGRWTIGTFTYSGPDCTDMSSIDLEFHPVAFTVGADGTVTGCECDMAGDTCEVALGGYEPNPPCLVRLSCRGNQMDIHFESPTSARVLEHRLAAGFGTCYGSGPFTLP